MSRRHQRSEARTRRAEQERVAQKRSTKPILFEPFGFQFVWVDDGLDVPDTEEWQAEKIGAALAGERVLLAFKIVDAVNGSSKIRDRAQAVGAFRDATRRLRHDDRLAGVAPDDDRRLWPGAAGSASRDFTVPGGAAVILRAVVDHACPDLFSNSLTEHVSWAAGSSSVGGMSAGTFLDAAFARLGARKERERASAVEALAKAEAARATARSRIESRVDVASDWATESEYIRTHRHRGPIVVRGRPGLGRKGLRKPD